MEKGLQRANGFISRENLAQPDCPLISPPPLSLNYKHGRHRGISVFAPLKQTVPPTQQQPIMRLVLNLRFEDSWSVTSAAFNRTLISSQISNHYGTSLTLVAPPGKRLFSRFKTVFTTNGDKRVLASCTKLSMTPSCICDLLTCPHKFKTERYRGGVRQFHCFLSMSEEFMKEEPLAGLAVKAWFLPFVLFIALFCSDCNWSQSQMQNGTLPKSCVCQ